MFTLPNSEAVEFLVGTREQLAELPDVGVLPAYSDLVLDFLSDLSAELLSMPKTRDFSDVAAFAFFIRRSALRNLKAENLPRQRRIGRGVALHIAPSNVPVNFAVSLMDGLLAGNANVVRVSNKPFEQVAMICAAMNRLLSGKFKSLARYVNVVRYDHSEEITSALSSICDVRVVWGGNRTIREIRKSPLPPRAVEMCFADRHSILVINADNYLSHVAEMVARGFYIDTFHTDQNACSSPRLVVWTGSRVEEAKARFWGELKKLVDRDYSMPPIKAVDKLDAFCRLAADFGDVTRVVDGNAIVRVQLGRITSGIMDYKEGAGFFFEYTARALDEILPVLNKPCQTISYLGVDPDEIERLVVENGVRGCDRIVPLGKTMDLSVLWDGYNMVESMSRLVDKRR